LRLDRGELSADRLRLDDARVGHRRREGREAERAHLAIAEAVRAAEHRAERDARHRVGHEAVLVDAIQARIAKLRLPETAVVGVLTRAAPDVTDLVEGGGDGLLDRLLTELAFDVDDDVLG